MSVEQGLRIARILVAALLSGLVLFGAVSVYVVEARGLGAGGEGLGVLWLVWLALAAGGLVAWRPVRLAMLREARRSWDADDPDPDSVVPHFLRLTTLQGALAEAPSFLAGTLYLISGQRLALIALALGAIPLAGLLRVDERFERFREQVALAVSSPT